MALSNLSELFDHTLRDIYYAEKHILKGLPKMAKKAESDMLRAAFEEHERETETHVERLEQVFGMLDKKAGGEKCPAIEGIIDEAEELMDEIDDADTRDAAMIAAAQAVEHYEITRYGTLISWAKLLGHNEAAQVLAETLEEEKAADSKLTSLGEDNLNKQAKAA